MTFWYQQCMEPKEQLEIVILLPR